MCCRDEIEDTLKPRVEAKQAAFRAKYGDASVFKENAVSCYGKANTLRSLLVSIQELYDEMGVYTSAALDVLKNIPNLDFDFAFDFAVQAHDQYQSSLNKQAQIGFIVLHIEVMLAAFTIATTTVVTTAALAFAAVGAVVAIFVAVAEIIRSVEQEREIRDTLRDNKRQLEEAERDIDSATTGMVNLQKSFCKDILVPLNRVAVAASPHSDAYRNFKSSMESAGTFVTEESVCNQERKFGAITGSFLKDTMLSKLDSIIASTRSELSVLRGQVEKAKELNAFAQTLKNEVITYAKKPTAIYDFVVQHKPSMLNTLFGSLFELYVYLAKTPLQSRTCYWGVSLEPFRSGAATASNYQSASVVEPCGSPEITDLTTAIAQDVANNLRPCRIVQRGYDAFIHDVSGLMRYLANGPLSSQRCYWGYDLAAIRAGSLTDAQLNDADFDYYAIDFLSWELVDADSLAFLRSDWCTNNAVCNDAWLKFVLCVVDKSWASVVGSCDGVPDKAGCHIDVNANECV